MRKLLFLVLLLCSSAWAQLDFHETFEGGTCVETWGSPGCPPTIVNAQTMTGDYYLDLVADDLQLVEDGLVNLGESWFSMQLRIDGDPVANSFFFRAQDSTNTTQCGVFVSSAQLLRFTNSGGTTTNTPHTLSLDTNYTIELRAKKGTGVDTAECAVRLDGGSWTTSTDGDWTANIDQTEIADVAAASFFFDEIKRCNAGAVGDGACDPPVSACTIMVDGLCAN